MDYRIIKNERSSDGAQWENLWVIALLIGLWILSIVLYTPGMP